MPIGHQLGVVEVEVIEGTGHRQAEVAHLEAEAAKPTSRERIEVEEAATRKEAEEEATKREAAITREVEDKTTREQRDLSMKTPGNGNTKMKSAQFSKKSQWPSTPNFQSFQKIF